jgi:hypothetical protein
VNPDRWVGNPALAPDQAEIPARDI